MDEPDGDSDGPPGSKMILSRTLSFGLLLDSEIEALKPLVRLIAVGIDEVLDRCYSAYASHFGNTCALSELEFRDTFKPNVGDSLHALLQGDVFEYAAQLSRLGELLAERQVPFAEVVGALQMFRDSAFAVFPESVQTLEFFRKFDNLNHARRAIIAESYFRACSAGAGARAE